MANTIMTFLSVIFFTAFAYSQDTSLVPYSETPIALSTGTGNIGGTLTTPPQFKTGPVALIIAGSGPTDRDGNSIATKNNSLKALAYGLAAHGIASVRFDKRGVGESKSALKKEADLRFDDYVEDVNQWIQMLGKDRRFSNLVVIGHSEGSLIGMIASVSSGKIVDKYISLAGPGFPANEIIRKQLENQPEQIRVPAFAILDSLAKGKYVDSLPASLSALFRRSVQPYLVSWFKYDPRTEIKKIQVPLLIAQGSNDIQVSVDNADALAKANSKGTVLMIKDMNHLLREVSGGLQENLKTYSDPNLPISDQLVTGISAFINKK